MLEVSVSNLRHVLCALLLIGRLGDVGTTYLATPTLALEANPLVRRFGWKYAAFTIALCLFAYLSPQVAVTLLITSLFVSASNAAKVWVMRTMGEQAYLDFCMDLARRSRLSRAVLGVAASSFFIVLAGGVILFFYSSPDNDWGFWIGMGVVLYGVAMGLYGTHWMVRLFRKAGPPLGGTE